jgi:hypothetical protein
VVRIFEKVLMEVQFLYEDEKNGKVIKNRNIMERQRYQPILPNCPPNAVPYTSILYPRKKCTSTDVPG